MTLLCDKSGCLLHAQRCMGLMEDGAAILPVLSGLLCKRQLVVPLSPCHLSKPRNCLPSKGQRPSLNSCGCNWLSDLHCPTRSHGAAIYLFCLALVPGKFLSKATKPKGVVLHW